MEWKWDSFGVLEMESFGVLETESFGVLEMDVSFHKVFFVRTYSRATVGVETRSLSKRSHYIIISLCCSLKNNSLLIVL